MLFENFSVLAAEKLAVLCSREALLPFNSQKNLTDGLLVLEVSPLELDDAGKTLTQWKQGLTTLNPIQPEFNWAAADPAVRPAKIYQTWSASRRILPAYLVCGIMGRLCEWGSRDTTFCPTHVCACLSPAASYASPLIPEGN